MQREACSRYKPQNPDRWFGRLTEAAEVGVGLKVKRCGSVGGKTLNPNKEGLDFSST